MDYLDFWIRIEPRSDAGFPVSVRSPAGEGRGLLRLDPDAKVYDPDVVRSTLRGVDATRGATDEETKRRIKTGSTPGVPVHVGEDLFTSLFTGRPRSLLDISRGIVGRERGLRIRLQINPEDPDLARLASLPWELLYNHDTRTYLGLSQQTPIVRYLEVPRPYNLPPFSPPLRVLIALANPKGTDALDLTNERATIEATWARLDGVEVTILEHATLQALWDAFSDGDFHVLHYMGHGGFDERTGAGALFLEDDDGRAASFSGEALGVLLRDEPSLRLVFLNACETGRASHDSDLDPFSGVAAALVMAGLPAVIAMQVPVSDRAAVAFSESFYRHLARLHPVDAAVTAGRKAIYRANPSSLEWATPVLFMRAPDGRLFGDEPPIADSPVTADEPPEKDERTAPPPKPDTRIERVQAALAERGYDPGPADGVLGLRTREAIRAFQRDAGFADDGIPGPQLFAALRDARAHEPPPSAPKPRAEDPAKERLARSNAAPWSSARAEKPRLWTAGSIAVIVLIATVALLIAFVAYLSSPESGGSEPPRQVDRIGLDAETQQVELGQTTNIEAAFFDDGGDPISNPRALGTVTWSATPRGIVDLVPYGAGWGAVARGLATGTADVTARFEPHTGDLSNPPSGRLSIAVTPVPADTESGSQPPPSIVPDPPERNESVSDSPPPNETESEIFVLVENPPELIGGLEGLQSKIQYPELARRAGIEGTVFVQLIVDEQGNVQDPVCVRDPGGQTCEEALRAVRASKFKPGRMRGQPVKVRFSLPVKFRLR